MNKLSSNKVIKNHSKFFFRGRQFFFVNKTFFFKLFYKIENVSKKTKKWLFKRLAKKRLVLNYRYFFRLFSKAENKNLIVNQLLVLNPLAKFFYKFNFINLVSLSYYKSTDFHLELIRRMARKIFGKRIFINLYITANFVILRRANQVRMGGGKGTRFFKKIYFVYPGCNVLEIRGLTFKYLNLFNKKLSKKLPFFFKLCMLNRC